MSEPRKVIGTSRREIWDFILHGEEHGVVDALAGAGKTLTIVEGVDRIPPGLRVGVFSFNRHVVEEANAKLRSAGHNQARAMTFHSFGFRTVKRAFPRVEFMEDKLDAAISKYTHDREVAAAVRKLTSLAKNTLIDSGDRRELEFLIERFSIELPELREDLVMKLVPVLIQDSLEHDHVVDYDDQLWLPVKLGLPVEHFDLVLVDEAQDTNRVQQELIMMACPKGRIVPVGDRNQSCYAFRGADADAMPNLQRRLEQTERGCRVLPLTITRRCPRSHVRLVQGLVPDFEALPDAPEGEILELSRQKALPMILPPAIVACRVNRHLIPVAYDLIRRGIKPVIRGRDIGQGLIEQIDKLRAADMQDLLQRLQKYYERERSKLLGLGERGEPLIEQLNERVECIIALCDGVEDLATLRDQIHRIFRDYEDDGAPRDFVLLGSIHRIKGLEANRVFILAPELIPHPLAKQDWEREQEKNLAYIAATRVKFTDTDPGKLVFVGRVPSIYGMREGRTTSPATAAEERLTEPPARATISLELETFVEE